MRILIAPTFARAAKKLRREQKTSLDEAVSAIAANPDIGEAKVGDLAGVRVFKFRIDRQLCLRAYSAVDDRTVKPLAIGSHENFYRDLKR